MLDFYKFYGTDLYAEEYGPNSPAVELTHRTTLRFSEASVNKKVDRILELRKNKRVNNAIDL